jgi:hypothetical protein
MPTTMPALRIEATLNQDGTLTLKDLPYHAGESVEVIVLPASKTLLADPYPLRGKPVSLVDPTLPVAEDDWHAAE